MRTLKYILLALAFFYQPAQAKDASDSNRYVSEGIDAAEQGNCHRAYSLFEKAMEKSSNDYQVYFVTGMTYMRCGESKKAKPYLERAITLAKQLTVQNKYSRGDIAVAYATLGDYGNARKYGEEAIKLFIAAGDTNRANKMKAFLSSLQSQ